MMVASIAVIWLAVGLLVAVAFGAAIWRTNRLREDEELPQPAHAEVRYLRQAARTRCQLTKTAMLNPVRKHAAKRGAVA